MMKLFHEKMTELRRRLYRETTDKEQESFGGSTRWASLKGIRFALLRNSTKIITSNCQVHESFTHHEEPRRIFLKNLRALRGEKR